MTVEQVDTYHVTVAGEPRGPLARAEMITLIEKGVIDHDTKIWKAGTEAWSVASNFIEFADRISTAPRQDPTRRLDIDWVVEASLIALRDMPGKMCLGIFMYAIVVAIVNAIVEGLLSQLVLDEADNRLLIICGLIVLYIGYSTIMPAGASLFVLRILRGEAAAPALAFSSLKWAKIKVLIPFALLWHLAVFAGLIPWILPGIFLIIAFSLCYCIIMDSNLGPIAAMRKSWRMVVALGWWRVFVIDLMMFFAIILSWMPYHLLVDEFIGFPPLEAVLLGLPEGVVIALAILVIAAVYEQARRNRERAGAPAE